MVIALTNVSNVASNKFRKKLQDKTVLEREEIVLEVEMLEKKAPVTWLKNGKELKPTDRYCID